jgi:hypothetical protein
MSRSNRSDKRHPELVLVAIALVALAFMVGCKYTYVGMAFGLAGALVMGYALVTGNVTLFG